MAIEGYCGKECSECTSRCNLDASIPCSPDCFFLNLDGSRNVVKCKQVRCDAIENPHWHK